MHNDQTADVELPGPPNPKALLGIISSPQTEETFNRRYARYAYVPFFDEARKAFIHRRLTKDSTTGVNTWHEQLIAGRVTPDDMKTLGYSNLAKWRSQTSMMLDLLASGEMDAVTLRAAFNSSKKSRVHYRNDITSPISAANIQFCIRVAEWFGAQRVVELEHHMAIVTVASKTIIELLDQDTDEAYAYAKFIDDHFNALRVMLPVVSAENYVADHNYRSYREKEFVVMRDGGLSPQQVAESALQHLSPERAVVAATMPRSVAEGVL